MATPETAAATRIRSGVYQFLISEADGEAATEISLTGCPPVGRIVRVKAVKTAGTAASLDPIIGVDTNPSGRGVVWENRTANTTIDEQPTDGAAYSSQDGILYWRSVWASDVDNDADIEILITSGL